MNKIKKDGLSIKALGRILTMIVENYKAATVGLRYNRDTEKKA